MTVLEVIRRHWTQQQRDEEDKGIIAMVLTRRNYMTEVRLMPKDVDPAMKSETALVFFLRSMDKRENAGFCITD